MSRRKPYLTDMRCMAMFCTARIPSTSSERGLALCQEHLLLAWSIVQGQLGESNGGIFELSREVRERKKPMSRQEREEKFGRVYYLQIGDLVKIGFSTNLERRLAQYPPSSRVIAIRQGTSKMERAEHIRYDRHLTDGREWFQYSKELEDDILIDDHRGKNFAHAYEGDPDVEEWKRRKADPKTRVQYRKQEMLG